MSKKSLFPIEVNSFLKKVRFSSRVKALVWMGSLWRVQVLGQILGYPDQRFNVLLELPFKPDQATSLFIKID